MCVFGQVLNEAEPSLKSFASPCVSKDRPVRPLILLACPWFHICLCHVLCCVMTGDWFGSCGCGGETTVRSCCGDSPRILRFAQRYRTSFSAELRHTRTSSNVRLCAGVEFVVQTVYCYFAQIAEFVQRDPALLSARIVRRYPFIFAEVLFAIEQVTAVECFGCECCN